MTTDTPHTDDEEWETMTISPFGGYLEAAFSRQLEKRLRDAFERLKEQYEFAAESVARMHEAAVGEIRGPIISVIDDIKAVRERAEKAEAEVERLEEQLNHFDDIHCDCVPKLKAEVEMLKASVQHYQDQALHFQHAWEKVQAMYNKLIYTSTKPIEPQQDDK